MRTAIPSLFQPRTLCAALLLLVTSPLALAQQAALWTDVSEAAIRASAERDIVPEAYRTVRLDRAALAGLLADAPLEARPGDVAAGVAVSLPMPNGTTESFRVIEAPIMAPGLQARYPQIRTYLGQGIETPAATVRFSVTPQGFNAQILRPAGTVYIDPYQRGDREHYLSYNRADYAPDPERVREAFEGETVVGVEDAEPVDFGRSSTENGSVLRTYRLALAATGEYTVRVSQLAGVPVSVESALTAQVIAMNRVNGIYERDVAVRMEIIENNEDIIYTEANTDPYANNSPSLLLTQNQTNLTTVIGSENYDIGHVFSTGGGGVAGLGVVCNNTQKARGVTGLPTPINDGFYVDYVSHEMGHQFRGNHTFNTSFQNCVGQRSGSTAYEPGSGSTIMAYAGICGGDDIQNFSNDYFHAVSLMEIVNFITNPSTGGSCPVETETGNEPPVVSADGDGFGIPILTPFVLTGEATDDTPESLTYNWEEFDLGPASPPPGRNGWNEEPPFFRSFSPDDEPVRYFPQFNRLLLGFAPVVGERLPVDAPSNGRRLRFRLTARDNALGGGGIGDVQIEMRAYDAGGPFTVTFANEDDLQVNAGPQEITWDVAGTDGEDIDTDEVDIFLSTDGGDTFDLLVTTDNDGSETVTIPEILTDEARIMIKGTGNVFFDVNDEEFEIVSSGVATEGQPEAAYALSAVYPNPLGVRAARATVNLTLEQAQTVRVAVYDLLGREVMVLHDGPVAAVQNRQFVLDAASLAGGVYLVRVAGETFTDVREMTVVR